MEDSIIVKINQAALRFLEPMSPHQTYETITQEAMKLIDAEYGSIFLEEVGELKRVYASADFLYTVKIRKRANTYKSFSEQRTIVAHMSHIPRAYPHLTKYDIKWTLFIPLTYQNKSFGVLNLNSSREVGFSNSELESLKLLGSLATIAIRKTQLYDQTKKALEIRDFFISLAAQELRTPLTTVNGYIALLKNKIKDDSPEHKWITKLSYESERFTKIIHELLEVNKIKSGTIQYNLKEASIKEIILRAIDNIKFTYPMRTFTFVDSYGNDSDMLIGDFDKLMQVFINLLDNAAKFSPADKPITITLKKSKNYASITIEDRGKGIAKKDLPYIFDGMYKPDYNQEHGMVIGLFIVKNIIHSHNGHIGIKSKLNHGTIVTIKLPIVK